MPASPGLSPDDIAPDGSEIRLLAGVAGGGMCTGTAPLEILIATMPPWPGPQGAMRVPDHWPPQP